MIEGLITMIPIVAFYAGWQSEDYTGKARVKEFFKLFGIYYGGFFGITSVIYVFVAIVGGKPL